MVRYSIILLSIRIGPKNEQKPAKNKQIGTLELGLT